VDGLDRIKFVTNYPRDMTPELIAAVRDLPKVSHYLHVPAQHGSDAVLGRMKRGYTIGHYMEMLGRVREEIPHAAVTSDFIVGFCGETDAEFQATLDLVRSADFKNSFIFKYSPRPGTKAYDRQPDDVPEQVKKARHQALLEAQTAVSLAGNMRFIGTRQQVLVEGLSVRDERRQARADDDDRVGLDPTATPETVAQLTGRTMCDRIVVFDAPVRLVGRLVDVDVEAAAAWSLAGTVADGLARAEPRQDLAFLGEGEGGPPPETVYEIALPAPAARVGEGHVGHG
jgi:tRNA-2-methylthio-N6-dimethylallyladenosine synthase